MTPPTSLIQLRDVLERLHRYAESEPQLLEFVPATRELTAQAEMLLKGALDIPALPISRAQTMPSRAHAERIVAIVGGLPVIGDDLDDATKLGVARLLANLVTGVTGAIFAQFPQVVPHE